MKQSKFLLKEEWIKKMCVCVCVCVMEYYPAIKKSEIMPFAAIRMNLETAILSERNQRRQVSYDVPYIWNLKKWYK